MALLEDDASVDDVKETAPAESQRIRHTENRPLAVLEASSDDAHPGG